MTTTASDSTRRRVRVGFDLYWLGETPAGMLQSAFGVRTPADVEKSVSVTRGGPSPDSTIEVTVHDGPTTASPALRNSIGADATRVEKILNETLRLRILTILPDSAGHLDAEIRIAVHLPFTGRRAPGKDSLPAPVCDQSGAIYFGDPAKIQGLSLVTGPISQIQQPDHAPWALRYSSTHIVSSTDAVETQIRSVLNSFETSIPIPATTGNLSLTWLITLDPNASRAWTSIPAPRSAAFSQLMLRTMVSVQQVLRTFVPYHYFLDSQSLTNRGRSWPMLVYSAMRPVLARGVHCYGYDILDPAPIHSALRWASRPLRSRLVAAQERLTAANREDLLHNFPICGRARIIKKMSRLPRYFGMLLSGENRILHVVRLIAESAHHIAAEAGTEQGVLYAQKRASLLYNQLRLRLDHLYTCREFAHLSPLISVAATWGLAAAQGLEPSLDLQLRIREHDTGRTFAFRRPISLANPRCHKALAST